MKPKKPTTKVVFIRLDAALLAKVEKAAKDERRSRSAQIAYVLGQAYAADAR